MSTTTGTSIPRQQPCARLYEDDPRLDDDAAPLPPISSALGAFTRRRCARFPISRRKNARCLQNDHIGTNMNIWPVPAWTRKSPGLQPVGEHQGFGEFEGYRRTNGRVVANLRIGLLCNNRRGDGQ